MIMAHAIARYNDRVRPIGEGEAARREIRCCLLAAKEKHLRKVRADTATRYVATGCCLLVCDGHRLVTVLPLPPESTERVP
jgi:hypothetical protein